MLTLIQSERMCMHRSGGCTWIQRVCTRKLPSECILRVLKQEGVQRQDFTISYGLGSDLPPAAAWSLLLLSIPKPLHFESLLFFCDRNAAYAAWRPGISALGDWLKIRINALRIFYLLSAIRHLSYLTLEILPLQYPTCTTKNCNRYPTWSSSRAMVPRQMVQ